MLDAIANKGIPIAAILTLCAAGLHAYANPLSGVSASPIACTMDVMLCPDGSSAGRSGSDCSFKCPSDAKPVQPKEPAVIIPKPEFNQDPIFSPANIGY